MRAFFAILLGLCLLGVLLGEVRGATKQGSSGPRQRRSLPPGWTDIGSDFLSGNELLPLTFFLKNSNLDELKAVVDRVSNPKSPFYTEYLSQEALARLIAPSSEFLDLFFAWLRTSLGSQDCSIDTVTYQDVVRLVLPLSAAEELLKVKYSLFQHDSSSAIVIRSLDVAHQIPASIRDGLDLIVGVNDFPPPPRRRRSSSTAFEMDPSLAFVDPKNSNTSNGTIITSLSGRDQQVTINFISAVPASASPPATLFASFFSTVPTFVFKQTFQTTPTCSIEAPTLGGSKQWQCSAVFDSLPNYIPLKVTIEEMAATGSLAPSVTSDYPCTPTPNTLPQGARSLYSIPQGIRVTHPNATQSVVEFEQQYYSPDDLAAFFQVTGTAPCPVTIVGPNDASNPGAEAALDIEWICAIAVGAPSYFWSIAANSTVEIDHILTWLYQMGNTTNPPSVNSLSYGMAFQNVDVFLGSGYAERTDVELQKLAARGITAIVASGDTGAPDIGPLPMSVPTCGLHADWPSQSTYITSVGSTFATPLSDPICYMPGGPNCLQNTIGEVGVSVDAGMRWTTGGGFAITPRPPYQNVVVPQYLNNTAALPSGFSQNPLAAGRAYPDAAMLGNDLQCVVAGEFVPISGTSASAPIFAGVITLLNNDRLLAGKKPLGFLNPMLYQMAAESAGFNDVTVGNNRCGAYGFSPVCCPDGYGAAIGFDSVAGLGTLNYLAARDYVLSLP